MLEPEIAREDLETWAGFLLDHSLGGIVPEDRVMIKGERICWPLMEVLERRGVLNRSAQHVDIVTGFRPGGCGRAVSIDGTRLVPVNGLWVVEG